MPSSPPFPIRVDELDRAFLSDALELDVISFSAERIGADRGMLGEVFRLTIEGADGSTTTVAAKFAALREGSLASALRGRNYERELRCYEELLTDTPVRVPAFHGAWYDPDTAHFLLLQGLVASDPSTDQIAGLSIDHARSVLTEVARLHAQWWGDDRLPRLDWLPRLDSPLRVDNLTTLARTGWEPLVALLGPDLPAVPDGFGAALPHRVETAVRQIASLPHTLIHCDLRADNLLVDPAGGSVTIVDWQGCGVGPAAFDLAYFLTQSLTIDDRRSHEAELIEHWRRELTAGGVDPGAAMAGFAESLWFGMAVACALPVISDSGEARVRALAHSVTTRTIAALADHGQLDTP